jgi:hypothetical protein
MPKDRRNELEDAIRQCRQKIVSYFNVQLSNFYLKVAGTDKYPAKDGDGAVIFQETNPQDIASGTGIKAEEITNLPVWGHLEKYYRAQGWQLTANLTEMPFPNEGLVSLTLTVTINKQEE